MPKQNFSVHDEKFALKKYKMYLDMCVDMLGSEETNGEELDECGRALFGDSWKGVFASDQNWPRHRGYAIVNLDTRSQPGSHWIAVGDGLVYDSFGRPNILKGSGDLPQADHDAEQEDEEDNCGPRCLAWLLVHQDHGSALAALI